MPPCVDGDAPAMAQPFPLELEVEVVGIASAPLAVVPLCAAEVPLFEPPVPEVLTVVPPAVVEAPEVEPVAVTLPEVATTVPLEGVPELPPEDDAPLEPVVAPLPASTLAPPSGLVVVPPSAPISSKST